MKEPARARTSPITQADREFARHAIGEKLRYAALAVEWKCSPDAARMRCYRRDARTPMPTGRPPGTPQRRKAAAQSAPGPLPALSLNP